MNDTAPKAGYRSGGCCQFCAVSKPVLRHCSYLVKQFHHLTGSPALHAAGTGHPDTHVAGLDRAALYVEGLDLLVRSRPLAIVAALEIS